MSDMQLMRSCLQFVSIYVSDLDWPASNNTSGGEHGAGCLVESLDAIVVLAQVLAKERAGLHCGGSWGRARHCTGRRPDSSASKHHGCG